MSVAFADRELRLRARVDRVADERDTARTERDEARTERDLFRRLLGNGPRYSSRCVYCGKRRIRGLACWRHRDLLLLDPFYNPEISTEPGSSTVDGSHAAGLRKDHDGTAS